MKKLFIIFAVLCIAAPAMAADWNFYGSARMATFRTDVDPDVAGTDSATNTLWDQQGNSRFGANVMVNDEIGGAFEYGTGVNLRKLYGTYKFGSSEILVGQTYTPTSSQFYSNSVFDSDGDLLGAGQFYVGRVPMLQWSIAGFKLALIRPGSTDYTGYTIETNIPKVEAAYKFKSDMFFAEASGGYQTYTLKQAGSPDFDIDSYVVEVGGGMTLGPVYFNLAGHMGTNLGNYGAYTPALAGRGLDNQAVLNVAANDTNDADGWGAMGVLGFNISEMFTIEAGYGHEEAEIDNTSNTQNVDQYYVNCTINIAPGFFIVPEVGMVQFSEDATDPEPENFYWGAKWQINF